MKNDFEERRPQAIEQGEQFFLHKGSSYPLGSDIGSCNLIDQCARRGKLTFGISGGMTEVALLTDSRDQSRDKNLYPNNYGQISHSQRFREGRIMSACQWLVSLITTQP